MTQKKRGWRKERDKKKRELRSKKTLLDSQRLYSERRRDRKTI